MRLPHLPTIKLVQNLGTTLGISCISCDGRVAITHAPLRMARLPQGAFALPQSVTVSDQLRHFRVGTPHNKEASVVHWLLTNYNYGWASRARTCDFHRIRMALYQLSYHPLLEACGVLRLY